MDYTNWVILDKAQSTNDVAFSLLHSKTAEQFTTVFAHSQMYGRGQSLSKWESEARQNINMSIVLLPHNMAPMDLHFITMITSISIVEATQPLLDNYVYIKWPNDIIVHEAKLAGVLIENVIQGATVEASVVGIGLNVNQEHFLRYSPPATSIHLLTGSMHRPLDIAADIMEHFMANYALYLNKEFSVIKQKYMERIYRLNQASLFYLNDELLTGTIYDITDEGMLCIDFENGSKQIFAPKELKYYF